MKSLFFSLLFLALAPMGRAAEHLIRMVGIQ
jgi:hypothetical protein